MSVAPATRALARLAWRELSRRRARTLLVIALVALPVAALIAVAVLNAASVAGPEEQRRSVMGGADVVILFRHDDAANGDTVAEVLRRLPEGSRVLRMRERFGLVPVRDADVAVQVGDLPLADPLTAGMAKLVRGRAPVGLAEIAASPTALRNLGLRLGDTLVSRRLGLRARITAEVIDPNDLNRSQIHTGAPLPGTSTSRTDSRLLVALPPGTAASDVARLRGPGREIKTVANCCPDDRRDEREIMLVISGLALFVVGLVVAAAFAVSARRQLRLIGLLSAVAGADERHVRRLALLQGALCGGAGVIAGFALGFAFVALLIAPNLDDIAGRVTGGVSVSPVELALIAAMAIAATAAAARIPLLAALGGRAPLRALPATVPVRGLATSALGTALLAVGLKGGGPRGLSLIGAVLIVLGFVLCAPALVAVLEPLASRVRGITRLAVRDVARQRARTGPLVAAILAVASLAVLGSTLIGAISAFERGSPGIARDEVLLSTSHGFATQHESATVPAALRARVRALLPRATEVEIGFYERRDAGGVPQAAVVRHRDVDDVSVGVAIAGPQLLELLGADDGRAAFDRGEVVVLDRGLIEDGHVRIEIPQPRGRAREMRVAATAVRADRPVVPLVISRQAAARLGLTPTATDVLFRAPNDLTASQLDALQAQAVSFDRGVSPQAGVEIRHAGNLGRPGFAGGVHEALLAIAAALTLAVVASGLALSAAEGKSDETMLVALGADPASRRRMRAIQAGLLVGIGGLLAVPAGLIPATVIIQASNEMRFAIPWAALAVLFALPAAAAAGAWLLTRPARWSPPATWAD
jgi:putative ABC transport system permease protein